LTKKVHLPAEALCPSLGASFAGVLASRMNLDTREFGTTGSDEHHVLGFDVPEVRSVLLHAFFHQNVLCLLFFGSYCCST